ncbi:hypothetical protein [Streptomyces sp. NPDC046805]|uniref:hypothetical protein n=1 Tax=Streptomyces sp. NPDC046805 TaxID=3155134 RepID=UPI0033F8867B
MDDDPECGPITSWIFAQRLAGHSITRALNGAGILCLAAANRARNPPRNGQRRVLNTERAILANPRYAGRQLWNRQRTDHDRVDPANTRKVSAAGVRRVLRAAGPGPAPRRRPDRGEWTAFSVCRHGISRAWKRSCARPAGARVRRRPTVDAEAQGRRVQRKMLAKSPPV